MTFLQLWFDVEKRYNTTQYGSRRKPDSCGLM